MIVCRQRLDICIAVDEGIMVLKEVQHAPVQAGACCDKQTQAKQPHSQYQMKGLGHH